MLFRTACLREAEAASLRRRQVRAIREKLRLSRAFLAALAQDRKDL
jgi:DNA-binding transcriptional regulator YiaG